MIIIKSSIKTNFKKPLKLFISVILAGTMFVMPIFSGTAYANSSSDTLQQLNSKYDQLSKQKKDLEKKIENAKSEKERQEAIKASTNAEIDILKGQVDILYEKIAYLESEIKTREDNLNTLDGDINENYELFKDRMKAIYMSDNTSVLGLVLGADSYGDFLDRAETIKRVAEHDKALIELLNNERDAVEREKYELSTARLELEDTISAVDAKNKELEGKLSSAETQIQNLEQLEQEFLQNKEALQNQMKEVQNEIDDIYDKVDNTDEYVGGEFMYPAPGFKHITSYYGWRFNHTDFHTGVDFSGPYIYGKPVVAANSGTVVHAQYTYTYGRGYGKYVIIDHGGGYSTLYGHMSKLDVNVGDKVKRGQKIGEVGSTGWSTGPHVHFEVREFGKHKNPLNYL